MTTHIRGFLVLAWGLALEQTPIGSTITNLRVCHTNIQCLPASLRTPPQLLWDYCKGLNPFLAISLGRSAIDKTIATIFFVIASVAAAIMVVNATYPAIVRSSSSIAQMSGKMQDRIESQISIVYATGELDSSHNWVDTDSDGYFDVTVWVKNVGSSRIIGLDQIDVFLGTNGSIARIPYVDYAGGSYPSWSYTLENGTEWTNTVTLKISIHYSSALTTGTYLVKVITPSGAYDEQYFSF